MKFAVNYSEPLIRLLNEGIVETDLIKCPDWDNLLAAAKPYRPITIHFDLEVGLGNTFEANFDRIKTLKDSTFTPHVNTHLVGPKTLNPNDQDELKKINILWREEIQWMINHLGAENVALEHYPYTESTPNILPAVNSKIFSQVILDTDCMFLLDLAHARITAETLKINPKDYIESLPLDRLVELHVTGIKNHQGVLTDHFEMSDEDWELLEWALNEINSGQWKKPKVVAFEYGGIGPNFAWRNEYDVLRKQLPRLYKMVHNQTWLL
jgi:uncharacterized protein (UPF0276 family)